jgi:hypothetical protein
MTSSKKYLLCGVTKNKETQKDEAEDPLRVQYSTVQYSTTVQYSRVVQYVLYTNVVVQS